MSSQATRSPPADVQHRINDRLASYLINLDGSPERLKRMTWLLGRHGLDFERVSAVDGRGLSVHPDTFDHDGYLRQHGRLPNPFEIGCYLSHVECVRRLLASPAEHALILEDDLEFKDSFLDVVASALDESRHWDILRLSTVSSGRKFEVLGLANGHRLSIALTREKGSGAYIVNRRAARWITETLIPMRLPYDIAFDLEHDAGLRACFVTPLLVDQKAEPGSTIQCGLKGYRLKGRRPLGVMWFRTRMETGRFLIRLGRLASWKFRRPSAATLEPTPRLQIDALQDS